MSYKKFVAIVTFVEGNTLKTEEIEFMANSKEEYNPLCVNAKAKEIISKRKIPSYSLEIWREDKSKLYYSGLIGNDISQTFQEIDWLIQQAGKNTYAGQGMATYLGVLIGFAISEILVSILKSIKAVNGNGNPITDKELLAQYREEHLIEESLKP